MFLLIACCPTLNVLLDNDVMDKHGKYQGVYTFQGNWYEMDYWVHTDEVGAIWYKPGSSYDWHIGEDRESNIFSIYCSSDTLEKKCPNNEGYVWNWMYEATNTYIAPNDIYIKCANEDNYCTDENPCGTGEGDCDIHDECQDGLVCGLNNCPDSLGYHSEFDCCYNATVGDEDFCTTDNPCGLNEGDCDSDNECEANLVCNTTTNSCPASLGFASDVNCCSIIYGCKFY